MATVLDIINKQKEEERKKYEFRHLMIGDVFGINGHCFIKIKEASNNCSVLKKSDPDAINLENGHYCSFVGGALCTLIRPLISENIHRRLTTSEIYKLPTEGRTAYGTLQTELNRLCRRLPQYTETEIMLALLRYYT